MVKLELKNHQVWQDFTEIVKQLDIDTLVKEHLDLCNYQVCGYWDEQDKYYETINLPCPLEIELISSFIDFEHQKRFLQLKFNLKNSDFTKIGGLLLIYDENLQFIDENWTFDSDFLECRVR